MPGAVVGIRTARERQQFARLLAQAATVAEQELARQASVHDPGRLPTRRYRWVLEALGGAVLAFITACVTLFLNFFIFSSVLHLSF